MSSTRSPHTMTHVAGTLRDKYITYKGGQPSADGDTYTSHTKTQGQAALGTHRQSSPRHRCTPGHAGTSKHHKDTHTPQTKSSSTSTDTGASDKDPQDATVTQSRGGTQSRTQTSTHRWATKNTRRHKYHIDAHCTETHRNMYHIQECTGTQRSQAHRQAQPYMNPQKHNPCLSTGTEKTCTSLTHTHFTPRDTHRHITCTDTHGHMQLRHTKATQLIQNT